MSVASNVSVGAAFYGLLTFFHAVEVLTRRARAPRRHPHRRDPVVAASRR